MDNTDTKVIEAPAVKSPAPASPSSEIKRTLRGHFDGVINGHACGWARDLTDPGRSLIVGILLDGRLVAETVAQEFRADLKNAGIGDGHCAFSVSLSFDEENPHGDVTAIILPDRIQLPGRQFYLGHPDPILHLMVSKYDFSNYQLFQPILNARKIRLAKPAQAAATDGEPLTAILARTDPASSVYGVPINAYMRHLRAQRKLERQYPLSSGRNCLDFAWWYITSLAAGFPPKTLPLGDDLLRFFTSPLGPSWNPLGSLPKIAYLGWLQEARHLRLETEEDFNELCWWFLTAFAPAKKLDKQLVPKYITSRLEQPVEHRPKGTPRLTRYQWLAWEKSSSYRDRYDLNSVIDYLAFGFDLLIHAFLQEGADSYSQSRFFSRELIEFWSAPIGKEPQSVTRFEFAIGEYCGINDKVRALGEFPWRSASVRKWFEQNVIDHFPNAAQLSSTTRSAAPEPVMPRSRIVSPPQFHLVGLTTSQSGLGVNLRMTETALKKIGLKPILHDISDTKTIDIQWDIGLTAAPAKDSVALTRDVLLFHINADTIPEICAVSNRDAVGPMYKIGFLLWELERVPDVHLLALDILDEIWVPSEFLKHTYRKLTEKPIINVGKGISLPTPARKSKQDFGIDKDGFCFLTTFDFQSSVERKNPLAAVDAFRLAFPDHRDRVALVIKTTTPVEKHWGDPYGQWPRIAEAASADPRIHIISEDLPFLEYLGVIAMCDAVVSTHRSEGFGYLPAYAMMMGKAVIVTDYSGTRDFCTEETAYLIPYTDKPVKPGEFIFDVDQATWADADVATSAASLQSVLRDRERTAAKAAAGQAFVTQRYSMDALASRYLERLGSIGLITPRVTSPR